MSGVSPSTVNRYFGTKEALVLWGGRAGRQNVGAQNVWLQRRSATFFPHISDAW